MYILATCLLVTSVLCQEVYENRSNAEPPVLQNTTATSLHPVGNTTTRTPLATESLLNNTKEEQLLANSNNDQTRVKNDAASWQIDATYTEPNISASRETDINITADSKEVEVFEKPDDKAKKIETPFKPSPVLESYYDLEDIAKPPSVMSHAKLFSPAVQDFRTKNKFSEESYFKSSPLSKIIFPYTNYDGKYKGTHPYKFERQVPESFHKFLNQPDSKPTVAFPVSIPAGGLYKMPYALHNEKPDSFEKEKEFDLFHGDGYREHKLKKPHSPWNGLLHLVTALLPVGLIVSALSPNVITIDSVQDTPNRLSKRSADEGEYFSGSDPLEACKRRMLCELYGPHTDSDIEELHSASESKMEQPTLRAVLLRRSTRDGKAREVGEEAADGSSEGHKWK